MEEISQIVGDISTSESHLVPHEEEQEVLKYNYKPLGIDTPCLRLLELLPGVGTSPVSCKLQTESLNNPKLKFEALSYVWGDPSPICPISIDGFNFLIAKNLDTAFRHLRLESEVRILWVDATCINQQDNAEKSSQVRQMHLIYSRAESVLAWTGIEEDESNFALEILAKIASATENTYLGLDPSARIPIRQILGEPGVFEALSAFGLREYWGRGWIVQEIVFGKSVKVIAGQSVLDWNIINEGVKAIAKSKSQHTDTSGPIINLKRIFTLGNRIEELRGGEKVEERASILDHIRAFRTWGLANHRDRVYAFANFPSREDITDLPIDYDTSVHDMLENFATWHIHESNSLDVLSSSTTQGLDANLGSWTPTWTRNNHPQEPLVWGSTTNAPIYHASKDTKVGDSIVTFPAGSTFHHVLFGNGYSVDKIQKVGCVFDDQVDELFDPKSSFMTDWEAIMNDIDLEDNPYSKKDFSTTDIHYFAMRGDLPFTEESPPLEKENDLADELDSLKMTAYSTQDDSKTLDTPGATELPPDEPERDSRTEGTAFTSAFMETWSFPNHETRKLALIEAFWRTLIGDKWAGDGKGDWRYLREHGVQDGRAARGATWRHYCDWHDGMHETHHSDILTDVIQDIQFPFAMLGAAHGRRFAVTEKNCMALVPAHATPGDLIVLLQGSQTPIVLTEYATFTRVGGESDEDKQAIPLWKFVGDCYVHGIMDGEAWEENEGKEKERFFMR